MARVYFIIYILLLLGMIMINASERRSKTKADQIIRDICEKLYDDDLYSDENRKWYTLCEEWIKTKDPKQDEVLQDENIVDGKNIDYGDLTAYETCQQKQYMKSMIQPRNARGGGSRSSGGGSRTGSGSRGGSRSSSSGTRFVNTRTGATISRPSGWQWSRSRLTFLPLASRFLHRSRSSSSRFTTPSTSSVTYYYCTSSADSSAEIQCSSVNGDSQCCEDETNQQPFCCGGQISGDFIEDTNRAVQILAQIFYTLAAMALCIHLFMRRFY